jgi:hypothetical protein
VPALSDAGEYGALIFRVAADGYDVAEKPARLEKLECALRFISGKVEPFFLHNFHHQRINAIGRL